MRRLLALPLLVVALAGCGADRARPVDLEAALASPLERRDFPDAGMSLEMPKGALVELRSAPGVFRAGIGDWFVAAFAYRRREPLPNTGAELEAARRRLVGEVRERDPRYRLVRSRATRLAGAPAVVLLGDQTLSRVRVRTRSLHIYKGDGEYVLELAAAVRHFASVDRRTFARVARSLRVTGKIDKDR